VRLDVALTIVDPTPTAVVMAATSWAEFPSLWRPMLDQVWSFLRGSAPHGLWEHGHNIMLYKDDVPHVEVGVQVARAFDPHGSVVPSTLPGGLVAAATHSGSVAEIGETHRAVRDWATARGHTLAGPRWEIYGDPDPSTGIFAVEVMWLVAEPAS
jgi:hypothetical protein